MTRDNHGSGPCAHCDGSGVIFDRRVGEDSCPECEGYGFFDTEGRPTNIPHSAEGPTMREETTFEKSARWSWPDGRPDL